MEYGQDHYRVEAGGLGVYAAVERDCPRDDPRRVGKPDGAWLPRVGPAYPGALSLFTETGLAKYAGSGLMGWHERVVTLPLTLRRATVSGTPLYSDRYQAIVAPETVTYHEILDLPAPGPERLAPRRGVIFWDFDGTLAHSTPLWGRAARAALADVAPGHDFDLARLKDLFNQVFPWHRPEVGHGPESGGGRWWAWIEATLSRCFETVGATPTAARAAAARIRPVILDPESYRVADGAVVSLTTLAARGWRHVVLSNHVPELPALMAGLGLLPYFEFVVTSAAVGYEKPHPEIFTHAVALAGAHGGPMWMIGDNPRADIDGAAAHGIPGILVKSVRLRDALAPIYAAL